MSTGNQFRTPDYFAEIACIFCFRQIRLSHVRLFEKELSIDLKKATLNKFLKIGQLLYAYIRKIIKGLVLVMSLL